MAQEQTPKPGSGDGQRGGSDPKPAGGERSGASDQKPPPPRRT
jgi:hypothetical protein